MNLLLSPALVVKSDTSIADSLSLMSERDSSYLLVQDTQGRLLGIFTDRDIRRKFELLSRADNLQRAISTVMTRPVKCLPVTMAHTAPEFMVTENVRHVPLIQTDKKSGVESLCGVITQRALFEHYVRDTEIPLVFGGPSDSRRRRLLGVVSPKGELFFTLEALFERSRHVDVERLWMKDLRDEKRIRQICRRMDAVVIDIDEYPRNEWPKVLKIFNEDPELENVFLVYNSDAHPENVQEVVAQLDKAGWLHVLPKPVDLTAMMAELERAWIRNSEKVQL